MRSLILYVPEGITLNLDEPGLGHPDGHEIIARHHRQSTRRGMGFNRDNPAFACLAHIGGTNPGLHIRSINGQWWAAHYESGECPSRRIPAPMSDEHKWQTEYWVRAAQDAGWAVDLEHSLPTGTRPDALIFGTVLTGIEVQRSSMTAAGASQRTKRALAAGVTDVWFTATQIQFGAGKLSPPWAHRVPTVGADEFPWTGVPPRRAATAVGMRMITAVQCTRRNWPLCPETRRQVCGKWHPIPAAWRGMTIDDVAAQFPAGEIVPLRFRRNARTGDVFLVPAKSATIYEELTGYRAPAPIAPVPPAAKLAGRVECANEQWQALLPLYVRPSPPVRSQAATPVSRTSRKKAAVPCGDCGYPMPDGICDRQACRMIRKYRQQEGGRP